MFRLVKAILAKSDSECWEDIKVGMYMANFEQVDKGMCKLGVSFNWARASKLRLEAGAVARRCLHASN